MLRNDASASTDNIVDVFRERSVACNGWELVVTLKEGNVELLKVDEIDDIRIWFTHTAITRQGD